MRVESHGFLAWETRHKAPRGRRQRVKSVRLEAKPPIGRPPARRAHERPTSPTYVPTLKQHRLSSGMSVRCDNNNNTTTKHPDSFVSSASPHKHSFIVPPVVLKPTSSQDITGGAAYVLYDSGALSADPPSVAPEERRRKNSKRRQMPTAWPLVPVHRRIFACSSGFKPQPGSQPANHPGRSCASTPRALT